MRLSPTGAYRLYKDNKLHHTFTTLKALKRYIKAHPSDNYKIAKRVGDWRRSKLIAIPTHTDDE